MTDARTVVSDAKKKLAELMALKQTLLGQAQDAQAKAAEKQRLYKEAMEKAAKAAMDAEMALSETKKGFSLTGMARASSMARRGTEGVAGGPGTDVSGLMSTVDAMAKGFDAIWKV